MEEYTNHFEGMEQFQGKKKKKRKNSEVCNEVVSVKDVEHCEKKKRRVDDNVDERVKVKKSKKNQNAAENKNKSLDVETSFDLNEGDIKIIKKKTKTQSLGDTEVEEVRVKKKKTNVEKKNKKLFLNKDFEESLKDTESQSIDVLVQENRKKKKKNVNSEELVEEIISPMKMKKQRKSLDENIDKLDLDGSQIIDLSQKKKKVKKAHEIIENFIVSELQEELNEENKNAVKKKKKKSLGTSFEESSFISGTEEIDLLNKSETKRKKKKKRNSQNDFVIHDEETNKKKNRKSQNEFEENAVLETEEIGVLNESGKKKKKKSLSTSYGGSSETEAVLNEEIGSPKKKNPKLQLKEFEESAIDVPEEVGLLNEANISPKKKNRKSQQGFEEISIGDQETSLLNEASDSCKKKKKSHASEESILISESDETHLLNDGNCSGKKKKKKSISEEMIFEENSATKKFNQSCELDEEIEAIKAKLGQKILEKTSRKNSIVSEENNEISLNEENCTPKKKSSSLAEMNESSLNHRDLVKFLAEGETDSQVKEKDMSSKAKSKKKKKLNQESLMKSLNDFSDSTTASSVNGSPNRNTKKKQSEETVEAIIQFLDDYPNNENKIMSYGNLNEKPDESLLELSDLNQSFVSEDGSKKGKTISSSPKIKVIQEHIFRSPTTKLNKNGSKKTNEVNIVTNQQRLDTPMSPLLVRMKIEPIESDMEIEDLNTSEIIERKPLNNRKESGMDENVVQTNPQQQEKKRMSKKSNLDDYDLSDVSIDDDDFDADNDLLSKLQPIKDLEISTPFDVPQVHKIETRMSCHPTPAQYKRLADLKLKIRKGFFTKEEDEILLANWNYFCKYNELEKDPFPFLNFQYVIFGRKISYLTYESRINFVRCLAKGLNNRLLFSVYKRFQKMHEQKEKGLFQPREDVLIEKYIKQYGENDSCFSKLSKVLNRDLTALRKHYYYLKDKKENTFMIKNSEFGDREEVKMINMMVELMGCKTYKELKNKEIPYSVFKEITKELKISSSNLHHHWFTKLHMQLFVTGVRDFYTLKRQLIDIMFKDLANITDYKRIDYQKYLKHFDGFTRQGLRRIFKRTLKSWTPPSKIKNIKEAISYLRIILKTEHINDRVLIHDLDYINELK